MNNCRCQCGRRKYADAALCDKCDKCWNAERRYDERDSGNPNYCQCGNPKISDASLCSECWDRQSAAYGD